MQNNDFQAQSLRKSQNGMEWDLENMLAGEWSEFGSSPNVLHCKGGVTRHILHTRHPDKSSFRMPWTDLREMPISFRCLFNRHTGNQHHDCANFWPLLIDGDGLPVHSLSSSDPWPFLNWCTGHTQKNFHELHLHNLHWSLHKFLFLISLVCKRTWCLPAAQTQTISSADTLAHHSQPQHTDLLQSVPACSTPANPSPLALTGNMVIQTWLNSRN